MVSNSFQSALAKLKCFSKIPEKIKTVRRRSLLDKAQKKSENRNATDQRKLDDQASERSVDIEEAVWGSTRRISECAVCTIVRKHLSALKSDRCWVLKTDEGSYNRVFIVQFIDGSKYVLRVPSCGTEGRWNKDDEVGLRSQALTMKYIYRNTKLLIPEVVGYDATRENELGHPYILMTFIEGEKLGLAWKDKALEADELEAKRLRMLKSVATAITELRHLTFDASGMLYFQHDDDDNPCVGPALGVNDGGIGDPMQGFKHRTVFKPEYSDTQEHFEALLDAWWNDLPEGGHSGDHLKRNMVEMFFLQTIADLMPRSCGKATPRCDPEMNDDVDTRPTKDGHSDDEEHADEAHADEGDANGDDAGGEEDDEHGHDGEDDAESDVYSLSPETFVLAPPDFDWQNILIGPDGSVNGFIDWDGVGTTPRYMGWSSFPLFLTTEMALFYLYDPEDGDPPDALARYRNAYAGFLKEAMIEKAGSTGDARFTEKSMFFEAFYGALSSYQMTLDTVKEFLRQILPYTELEFYLNRIADCNGGGGWREGEREWLMERLAEMFSID